MAQGDAELATITANNTALGSIAAAVTVLQGGQTTIAAQMAALKAANPAMDFTAMDAALATQSNVIAGLNTAIPANTPLSRKG